LQVRGVVTGARIEVMQNWISDVDLAVSASRAAAMQVPQDVLRAAGHVRRAPGAAATERHAPVASCLHQNDVVGTRTVGDEVLSLAVIWTQHTVPL